MELLLNLLWLLLVLPACWLWRVSRNDSSQRKFSSLQCVLTLTCVLVILFPVISATDDLHAMRAEMEESQVNKQIVGQAHSDRASLRHNRSPSPPALLQTQLAFTLKAEYGDLPVGPSFSLPAAPFSIPPGRAPPVCTLA